MKNVEVGVAAATATVSGIEVAVKAVVRVVAFVLPMVPPSTVTPILAFLRQGRSSLSAVPGDIKLIQGGIAASA